MQNTEIYIYIYIYIYIFFLYIDNLLLYVCPKLGTISGMGLNTGVKLSPLLLGNLEIMLVT
jgi:hypothetical protein